MEIDNRLYIMCDCEQKIDDVVQFSNFETRAECLLYYQNKFSFMAWWLMQNSLKISTLGLILKKIKGKISIFDRIYHFVLIILNDLSFLCVLNTLFY